MPPQRQPSPARSASRSTERPRTRRSRQTLLSSSSRVLSTSSWASVPRTPTTKPVTKGQWNTDTNKYFLRASTLGTGDVTAASGKQSGSNYIITINIKNGNSYATKGTATCNAPSTRAESASATRTRVTMTTREPAASMTPSTKFTAAQRSPESYWAQSLPQPSTPATGHFVKLDVKFDITVNIDIGIGKPTATGTSYVKAIPASNIDFSKGIENNE